MSKISEQKALEAYPNKEGTVYHSFFGVLKFDGNAAERRGYQEGYDQAFQDFLEKACEWLEPTFKNIAGYNCGGDLINDFKNYMQDESEN